MVGGRRLGARAVSAAAASRASRAGGKEMTWVRLDDSFLDHAKFVELDAAPLRVWLRALCYCNRHATDGFVSNAVLRQLGATQRIREQLARAPAGYTSGLWDEADGGIVVHDYEDYQPTAQKRSRVSEARAENGRRGGIESGASRRRASLAQAPSEPRASLAQAPSEPRASLTQVSQDSTATPARAAPVVDNRAESHETAKPVASKQLKQESKPRPVPARPVPTQREGDAHAGGGPSSGEPTRPVLTPDGVIVVGEPLLALDTPITPELRAIAEGATGATPVQDVAGAWVKFCGLKLGTPMRSAPGSWQMFCVNEAKIERRERDRREQRESEQAVKNNPAESPAVREERRRRDDAHEDAKRNAVRGAEAARAGALALEAIADARRKATS